MSAYGVQLCARPPRLPLGSCPQYGRPGCHPSLDRGLSRGNLLDERHLDDVLNVIVTFEKGPLQELETARLKVRPLPLAGLNQEPGRIAEQDAGRTSVKV